MAAVLVGAFVLTSSLVATLPQFRFESQFPTILPFFAWAGATGAGHVANLGRARSSRGAPRWARVGGAVRAADARQRRRAAPSLPWWLAVVAALRGRGAG